MDISPIFLGEDQITAGWQIDDREHLLMLCLGGEDVQAFGCKTLPAHVRFWVKGYEAGRLAGRGAGFAEASGAPRV